MIAMVRSCIILLITPNIIEPGEHARLAHAMSWRPGCRSAGEVVRVDRPLLWSIMIVGMKRYYWLIVW